MNAMIIEARRCSATVRRPRRPVEHRVVPYDYLHARPQKHEISDLGRQTRLLETDHGARVSKTSDQPDDWISSWPHRGRYAQTVTKACQISWPTLNRGFLPEQYVYDVADTGIVLSDTSLGGRREAASEPLLDTSSSSRIHRSTRI